MRKLISNLIKWFTKDNVHIENVNNSNIIISINGKKYDNKRNN